MRSFHQNVHYFVAKFNCIVPGTLANSSDECEVTYTTEPSTNGTTDTTLYPTNTTANITETTDITSTTLDTTVSEISTLVSDFKVGSELYVLIAIGAGILILTVAITVLCPVITYKLVNRKSQSYDLEMVQYNENVTAHPDLQLENGHQQPTPGKHEHTHVTV